MSKNSFNTATTNDITKARFAASLVANDEVCHFKSAGVEQSVNVSLTEAMEELDNQVSKVFGKCNKIIAHSQADVDNLFKPSAKISYPSMEANRIAFTSKVAPTILEIASDFVGDTVYVSANQWNGKLQAVVDGQTVALATLIIVNQSGRDLELSFSCDPLTDDATASVPTVTGLETTQGGSIFTRKGQAVQLNSIVMTYSGATGGITATAVTGQSDLNN